MRGFKDHILQLREIANYAMTLLKKVEVMNIRFKATSKQ